MTQGSSVKRTPRGSVRGEERHDPDVVARGDQFAGPVMRPGAGFQADEAGRTGREEGQYRAAPQLPAQRDRIVLPDAADPEDALGEVDADGGNPVHGGLPRRVCDSTPMRHIAMPGAAAIHPINGGRCLIVDQQVQRPGGLAIRELEGQGLLPAAQGGD